MSELTPPELDIESLELHSKMLKAADDGDMAALKAAIAEGANPNTPVLSAPNTTHGPNASYRCVTSAAAYRGDIPMMKYLLDECGADPNMHGLVGVVPALHVASRATGNHAMIEYLAHHPKVDINAAQKSGFPAWQDNLFEGERLPERLEYANIIINNEEKPLTLGHYPAYVITRIVQGLPSYVLETVLDRWEESDQDLSKVKRNDTTGSESSLPTGAAAKAGAMEQLILLKERGFPIEFSDDFKSPHGDDNIHPPILMAAQCKDSTEPFYQLAEWGADIHVASPDGTNLLSAALHQAHDKPDQTLELLRYGFKAGVKPSRRTGETIIDDSFRHLMPHSFFSQNHMISEMIIAGGAFDPAKQERLLDQSVKYFKTETNQIAPQLVAYIDGVVRPYCELPPKLPEDLSDLTRADLVETNEKGLSLLDHPNTWFRYHDVQKQLAGRGEAFTLEELQQGTMKITGRDFLSAIAAFRGIDEMQEILRQNDRQLTADDLVDAEGTPTSLLASVVDFGQIKQLFSYEMWKDGSAQDIRRVYNALDDSDRDKVGNFTQLTTATSRNESQSQGRLR